MRLVCPNCDAEYEVDNAAIPLAGRDVQCSNCGHAWFQTHPEVEVEEAALVGSAAVSVAREPEAVLAEDARHHRAARVAVAPEPETVLEKAEAQAVAASAAPEPSRTAAVDVLEAAPSPRAEPGAAKVAGTEAPPPAPRNIDESVLAVLREEAAREAAARRAETPPALETQTEMPLDQVSGRRANARSEAMQPATRILQKVDSTVEDPVPEAVRSRGDRLPAIDEINSTLRATSDRAGDMEDDAMTSLAPRRPARGGFGSGFLTLILLGVIILALYVFAPLIAAKVPALAGAANAYVVAVNVARVWLDDRMRALIGVLHSFTGGGAG